MSGISIGKAYKIDISIDKSTGTETYAGQFTLHAKKGADGKYTGCSFGGEIYKNPIVYMLQ